MEVINTLSWRLLGALRDDDFSVSRFSYVERLRQGPRLLDQARRQGERDHTGRQVDEEDGPPAPAEDVRVDEDAAEQRAGDSGEAGHGPERAEDGRTLLFGERDVHDGEYLREHRRGRQTLDHPEQDEQARAGRQPAQQ
jgi:hypothetical protein